ncbi:DNA-binding protein [Ascodesmis nigricans]|uniref:DNA-binding protein n=1 Tax=Ascodesmis nigricans TaxID=341454 RepID=A0A4S2MI46_9PEZI|nr:DNA-binding protein [Ascodesmis nigricans]
MSTTAPSSAPKPKKSSKSAKPAKSKFAAVKGEGGGKSKGDAKEKDKVHRLSLKGSSKLVTEFFEYALNSILFQRGVYPAEDFSAVKKYGLNMLVTADDDVKAYIRKIMGQLGRWMLGGKISKLVVVISSKDTGEHLERWQFDVQLLAKPKKPSFSETPTDTPTTENPSENTENTPTHPPPPTTPAHTKTEKEIQEEIQSLFRQITASVTFLPMLDGRCTFNVLVYADGDAEVPMEWGDSDAKEIDGGEKVTLRSWGTSSHRVDTLVSYRLAD